MAEFCLKCWNELNGTDFPASEYILSEELELCEGCGEFKKVIVTERTFAKTKRLPLKIFYMFLKYKRK